MLLIFLSINSHTHTSLSHFLLIIWQYPWFHYVNFIICCNIQEWFLTLISLFKKKKFVFSILNKQTHQKNPLKLLKFTNKVILTFKAPKCHLTGFIFYITCFFPMKHINLARIDIFSIWDAFSQDVSISVHLFIFSSTQLFNTHSAKLCARNERYSFISLSRGFFLPMSVLYIPYCVILSYF